MASEIAHITMAMAVIIVQTVMMMPLVVVPPVFGTRSFDLGRTGHDRLMRRSRT